MSTTAKDPKFAVVRVVVKVLAAAIGLGGTLLTFMSLMGLVTGIGWIRFGVAALVAVVLPMVVLDRVLPANPDAKTTRGLPTDVLTLTWMTITLLFLGVGAPWTRTLVSAEADRMRAGGFSLLADGSMVVVGLTPVASPAASSSSSSAAASAAPPAASSSQPDPSSTAAPSSAVPSAAPSASASPPPADDAGASEGGRTEKTPAELFKVLSPSVVSVNVRKPGAEGGGTGFLIDKQGTIATNHHVIEGGTAIRVRFHNGAQYAAVDVLVDDAANDLALLAVDLATPTSGTKVEVEPLVLGDSNAVLVGERALSIGNPLGLEHTLTDGLISARRVYEGKTWIQMSVPVSPGNSGGPLFNMRGEVIGVTTAQLGMFSRGQNLNLAVPINQLKSLIKPTYPQRKKMGEGSPSSQW